MQMIKQLYLPQFLSKKQLVLTGTSSPTISSPLAISGFPAILSFPVYKMEHTNMQVSYYLARPVHSLHPCTKKKKNARCAFLVPIKCPPGIFNWLKISGCQPDIHFPAAEATESIPPECFKHRRDQLLIHATRNTVIPCIYMP